ncbi:MAG TPA: PQQ-binding-like beta-propeller repeat protein [Candidatus Polarisedimenticolia bacterium]|nr:PQQ-binding-like beta-propeller repeat protein [Candidatus Polarisedimenticolia bacterium]
MDTAQSGGTVVSKPIRLWPGIALAALQLFLTYLLPLLSTEALIVSALGGVGCAVAVLLWWAFFSRIPHAERWGGLLLAALGLFAAWRLIHVSIATGAMGMLFPILAVPLMSLTLVAWAALFGRRSRGPRRAALAGAILLASGTWLLLKTGGFTGELDHDFMWRWTATPEERLVARGLDEPGGPAEKAAVLQEAEWPGFRGSLRDGVVRGVRIRTDWSVSPPVELWRRPIGPGWSSFAVAGGLAYTQEQRGEEEIVSCYNLMTGEPVWRHRDAARFWESNAGAGPRATPTLAGGRVYTLGATGIVNALDAADGTVIWSRNAAADTGQKLPGWGFSASPVVIGSVVVVATAGVPAAYDAATGEPRWIGPKDRSGYSSPHLATIAGVPQIVMMSGAGATGFSPADGAVLWEHGLPQGARIVQPAVTPGGDLLIAEGDRQAMHRLAVSGGDGGWAVRERWTSIGLKPYFNDFVIHKDHAYGFDGSILSCIDLEAGERKWKGGRYGNGQLVLLADQDLLVVLSEQGELVLVNAAPDQHAELARFPAITGKTWNHPVVVKDILLARNGEEMAAFRLPLEGS